ncbi:fatty acyl-AMP ligase [Frankia sp. Ag45/Mut15]|uniref:Fatty acyl-AMP ligase n=1 Tax=Frankia umida TaxID=573489 RepID=A0ABT0K236_9ACTN|nr:fatty acyl-AMP ligase [Frankia umida]MCK9877845.1 fatty acyl-AMP ligase [Frankia umida]
MNGPNFVRMLTQHAERAPDRQAVIFCRNSLGGDIEQSLSYAELDRAARLIAAGLAECCARGDRVLLLYPQGLDFVCGFVGCLYAGLLPVVAPPTGDRAKLGRIALIAADAEISAILTVPAEHASVADVLAAEGHPPVPILDIGDLVHPDTAAPWQPVQAEPGDTAFLQYTSGSTSTPRGVVVSHGNLVHNIRLLLAGLGWEPGQVCCGWIPMFHDMGLILTLLSPLYLGTTTVLLAPSDFLRRPYRWLHLVSRYRATITAAPNFAYELCVRRVTDAQLADLDLDLSAWRIAVCGAEPVDAGTLRRFADRFAPAGFRLSSFAPGYGLAETTLALSTTHVDEPPRIREVDAEQLAAHRLVPATGGRSTALVASGRIGDNDVRIIDPQTRQELPDGLVGEVWVRGASVTGGYWRRPDLTAELFQARTAGGETGFLRTGDLGCTEDSWLFVTGRLKEVLIVHGRNLYPQDIERELCGLHAAFGERTSSAFSVPAPTEEIVVVQEIRPAGLAAPLPELASLVKARLSSSLGTRVANVVFVAPGRVPRTTSGKLQRGLLRDRFMRNELKVLFEDLLPELRRRYRANPVAG